MMVTYNRLNLTKETLSNINENNTGCKYNLVIVDNNSTDGTVEFLKDLQVKSNNITCHFNSNNKGIAIGRNQALRLANELNTDWFCTIDNDVLMPDEWLIECIDIIKRNPKYGMIGVNMEGKEYKLVTENNKTFQYKAQGNLGTACMVFPKSLHKMLGYFNTEYKLYAHEDADYGMRTRALGYKLGYIKEMGKHLGENENDVGEYREFKNKYHKDNLAKFHENARLYMTKQKSLFVPFKE